MSLLLLFNSQLSVEAYKEFIGALTPGDFDGAHIVPEFIPDPRQFLFAGRVHDVDNGGTIRESAFIGTVTEIAFSGKSRNSMSGRTRVNGFAGHDKSLIFEGEGNE